MKTIRVKIMEKIKMKRRFLMHCLLRSNVGDVKMMPLMPYMTDIFVVIRSQNCLQKN